MSPNKKVLVTYFSDRKIAESNSDHDTVSLEELVAETVQKTGESPEKVKEITRLYFEFIARKVKEDGEFYIECPGEYDILIKKTEYN